MSVEGITAYVLLTVEIEREHDIVENKRIKWGG